MRSSLDPWGRLGRETWSEAEVKEIDEANKQVKVVIELLWYLLRCGVPWALEHPRSSFLWKTAEIQELLHDGPVDTVGLLERRG